MGFAISSDGILDISPYTKSKQRSVIEKHLRDMQKTTTLLWLRGLLLRSATATAVADKPIIIIKATLETKGFLTNENICRKCKEMHKKLKN